MAKPNLDHPSLGLVKQQFPAAKFLAAEFRGQTSLVVPLDCFHDVMTFLRDDPACAYNFFVRCGGCGLPELSVATRP